MATVSSLDNQLPLLQADNEKPKGLDDNALVPFGQWLLQKSEVNAPSQQLNHQREGQPEPDKMKQIDNPREGTKLFADQPADKTRKSIRLFKDPQPVTPQRPGKTTDDGQTQVKLHAGKSGAQIKTGDNATPLPNGAAVKQQGITNRAQNIPNQAKTAENDVSQRALQTIQAAAKNAATTPSPIQEDLALTRLKTNVKAIFNNLTPLKSSAESAPRTGKQPGVSTNNLPVDTVKPIRLTTISAAKQANKHNDDTTIQHLKARKSATLDAKIAADHEKTTLSEPVQAKEAPGKSGSKHAVLNSESGATLSGQNKNAGAALPGDVNANKKGKYAARNNGPSGQHIFSQKNSGVYTGEAQGFQAKASEPEWMQDHFLQTSGRQSNPGDQIRHDNAPPDSNANNLLSRGQAALHIAEGKNAGKSIQAAPGRSSAWVKTLSERTAEINRLDPDWKVLEMKLDEGDGHMTIKVMREDEHVTISVQFSDDALRAHAESQTNQIMDSLKEQYGKDVTFMFADQRESAFDSSVKDHEARRRRLTDKIDKVEKAILAPRQSPLAPDQHLWIG